MHIQDRSFNFLVHANCEWYFSKPFFDLEMRPSRTNSDQPFTKETNTTFEEIRKQIANLKCKTNSKYSKGAHHAARNSEPKMN